jgi:hypothetical protein
MLNKKIKRYSDRQINSLKIDRMASKKLNRRTVIWMGGPTDRHLHRWTNRQSAIWTGGQTVGKMTSRHMNLRRYRQKADLWTYKRMDRQT